MDARNTKGVRWLRHKLGLADAQVHDAASSIEAAQHVHDHRGSGEKEHVATGVFADINQLAKRDNVKEMQEAAEKEKKKYKDTMFGKIAQSDLFERVTIVVIIFNALCIGWDTDHTARFGKSDNLYTGPPQFIVLENLFTVYFSGEILIRFIAYRVKIQCLCDAWFVFDSVLVLFMVMETWIMPFLSGGSPLGSLSILRLLRLLRITRVAKLMRMFPELMMIIKGITAATKAVFWTAILLIIITYTWAILFTNEYHQGKVDDEDISDDQIQYLFGSMGKSMRNLLIMGTILDDVTYCTDTIRSTALDPDYKGNWEWMLFMFIMYILLNSFTMMNMLVGILVEVVGSTAEAEKARIAEEHVKESIIAIFQNMDKDGSGMISREEFMAMRQSKTVMKSLKRMDIKEKEFDMYGELLFETDDLGEDKSISFDRLLNMIMRLRPGTPVSALDFATLKQLVSGTQSKMKDRVANVEKLLETLSEETGIGKPGEEKAGKDGKEQKQRINVTMLSELERTASSDIIAELQRRLGMANLEETGVPLRLLDDELQRGVRDNEAFHTLGVPQNEAWLKDTHSC